MAQSCTPEYFLLAARRAEIAGLMQLATSCRLVTDACALVHQLQRERGMSNVYLASIGERFAAQRLEQVQACIKMEQSFRQDLQQLDLQSVPTAGSMRLFNRLAWVLHGLDGIALVREQVLDQGLSAEQTTQAFSELIAGLLSVVFEAADIATDPDITRLLVALFNFMQGKEYAGQERAWAAIGFAAGRFPAPLCERLRHLLEAQQRCFETFVEFAPRSENEAWSALEACEATDAFRRLRQVMMRAGADASLDGGISEIWYDLATQRIDRMKSIEDALSAALLACCEEKIARARDALRDHRNRLQSLAMMKAPPVTPVTVLMAARAGEEGGATTLTASGVKPELARSLYELMAAQTDHLRQLSEELEQARRALEERKLLERAKGLLMQHRGLSEAEAWRTLRQTAMNSNRSLADVATQVISMSGLLTR